MCPPARASVLSAVVLLLGACGGAGPAAPTPVSLGAARQGSLTSSTGIEASAVVEALFLGTGPLARREDPGCDNSLQRLRGWPRGSLVRAVSYASIDSERGAAIGRALQQVSDVLGSTVAIDYRTRGDLAAPAAPVDGEISIFGVDAPLVPPLCGISSPNCQVVRYSAGAYVASRVIFSMPYKVPSDGIVSHELGHAFGLCHIDLARGGAEPALSVMDTPAAGRFTPLDTEAFRLVYAAGLSPGDSRQRFVAAGLIAPR